MASYANLNAQNAYIWRIIHKDNLPWILANGLHCGNSTTRSPSWVNIGNTELIQRRNTRFVPLPPHGTLNDYVPFYFTPFSPMMYNIYSGRGGVVQRRNEEIVILVSTLKHIHALEHPFVFTDGHAYTQFTNFYDDLSDLTNIDWSLLQSRNFQRDPNDLSKMDRYQAEALIYNYLPANALMHVICYTETVKSQIVQLVQASGLQIGVHAMKEWYF